MSRIEQDKDAKAMAGLARRFTALVRACGKGRSNAVDVPAKPRAELDNWFAEARLCGVAAIETFAVRLEADGAAVRAALVEPWSSGQAEGPVKSRKMLKRQSYGCASSDLLRQRVPLAV